jgi:tripartite-type tricarboxylate transporter receptor subunit TctC
VQFWSGALVPAGTSQEIIDLLARRIAAVLAQPDVKERLGVLGFDTAASTPQEFAAYIKSESDKWRKVVTDANIKID